MDDDELSFPPLLNGISVPVQLEPFREAVSRAGQGDSGAGDLYWSQADEVLDLAIVLEPEVERRRSVQMLYTLMVAFGDSFGAIGPSELGLFYRWPDQLLINGAKVGMARIAMPDCADDAVPDWLVLGLNVRMTPHGTVPESGMDLQNTSLWDEGCGDLTREHLLNSFSRHFMTWVHNWSEDGFKPVHEIWLGRADGKDGDVSIAWQGKTLTGKFLGIDDEGNLLLKHGDESRCLAILDIVEGP